MLSLAKRDILRIVNRYIGVNGGYLGTFSYRTHAEFYPEFCGLDIDPDNWQGTTRERFISILKSVSPDKQAQIIRGVLDKFPLDEEYAPPTRTAELRDELIQLAWQLEGASIVPTPVLIDTSLVVARAIADAEKLIEANDYISGVDRLHTAFQGHLKHICRKAEIEFGEDTNATSLFKLLRQQHPAFQSIDTRAQEIKKVVNSLASIVDALNPIRNNASVAHPNDQLLDKAEAKLVVNAIKTLLHYVDDKIPTESTINEGADESTFDEFPF